MKIRISITVIAVMLVFSSTAQDLNLAKDLIENERFDSAEKVLEAAPADPEANYLLLKTYIQQEKTEEARELVNSRVSNNRSEPFNNVAYARYLLAAGNKTEARAIFNTLLDDKKNRKNAALMTGIAEANIEEENGDPGFALEVLKKAEDKNNKNASISLWKGLAYRKLSDANNAYLSYQDALKKDPGNVRAHYLLARIFIGQKNPDIYLPHLMQAYALDSAFAPVLEALYDYYYYRDLAEARKYLEKFVAHSDPSVENDYRLVDMLYLTRDNEKAIAAAEKLLKQEAEKAQPRLYKLLAYAQARKGDTALALQSLETYFVKTKPASYLPADFELRAQLTAANPSALASAEAYYEIAAEMDTLVTNKRKYAEQVVTLLKRHENPHLRAKWLGKQYQWSEKATNVDLFNWGLAHYTAAEYKTSDSVFQLYTEKYPEDVYGYFWRAQVNAAADSTMELGLAIPHYQKFMELAEKDIMKNKNMLLKAYGYMGGYESNHNKNYENSLEWFRKYLALDPANEDIKKYVAQLEDYLAKKK